MYRLMVSKLLEKFSCPVKKCPHQFFENEKFITYFFFLFLFENERSSSKLGVDKTFELGRECFSATCFFVVCWYQQTNYLCRMAFSRWILNEEKWFFATNLDFTVGTALCCFRFPLDVLRLDIRIPWRYYMQNK